MNISVIIPAINEEASIERAVRSGFQAGASEVIVADGGSNDATREIAASLGCRVITCPAGRASQQNHGAADAQGDILLFLHADCSLGTECIDQIRSATESSPNCYGGFRQKIDHPGRIYRMLESGNAQRIRILKLIYGDQGIFLPRQLFDELDGFADVPLMEDVILSRQLGRRSRPQLLPGPIQVGARRWVARGPIRQTVRNWSFLLGFALGVSPEALAKRYPRHDQAKDGLETEAD